MTHHMNPLVGFIIYIDQPFIFEPVNMIIKCGRVVLPHPQDGQIRLVPLVLPNAVQ